MPTVSCSILEHCLHVVAAAAVHHDPFPHFLIDGFFPEEVYRELLASLPDAGLYEPMAYGPRSPSEATARGRFKLNDACLARLSAPHRELWLAVRDVLTSPVLKRCVFGQLSSGLALRYRVAAEAAADLEGYALPELFRETRGYSIKPHPDTRKKVVTMQIALPEDRAQAELGTEFYRLSLNPLHVLREPRGFVVAKRAPFLPNAAYAFSVLNTLKLKSWHGRTTLAEEVGVRNSILNIWYGDPANVYPETVRQSGFRLQASDFRNPAAA